MTLSNERKKHLRHIGHALKPVLTVGDKGLSGNVLSELDRALEDHELIKIKLRSADKTALIEQLIATSGAELVQSIGHIVLVYRAAKKPDPKLSNLLRHPPTA